MRGQVPVRDTALAVLGRRRILWVVGVRMPVIMTVMVLLEHVVKKHVRERHDVEAEQPKCGGEYSERCLRPAHGPMNLGSVPRVPHGCATIARKRLRFGPFRA